MKLEEAVQWLEQQVAEREGKLLTTPIVMMPSTAKALLEQIKTPAPAS